MITDEQIDHLEGIAIRDHNEEMYVVTQAALSRDHQSWTAEEKIVLRRLCTRFWNSRANEGRL